MLCLLLRTSSYLHGIPHPQMLSELNATIGVRTNSLTGAASLPSSLWAAAERFLKKHPVTDLETAKHFRWELSRSYSETRLAEVFPEWKPPPVQIKPVSEVPSRAIAMCIYAFSPEPLETLQKRLGIGDASWGMFAEGSRSITEEMRQGMVASLREMNISEKDLAVCSEENLDRAMLLLETAIEENVSAEHLFKAWKRRGYYRSSHEASEAVKIPAFRLDYNFQNRGLPALRSSRETLRLYILAASDGVTEDYLLAHAKNNIGSFRSRGRVSHVWPDLSAARKKCGLSRTKIAAKLDVTVPVLTAWENGRTRPHWSKLWAAQKFIASQGITDAEINSEIRQFQAERYGEEKLAELVADAV